MSEKYPEHVKLTRVVDETQACGEFLDWLTTTRGYSIAEQHSHLKECFEDEQLVCGTSTDELFPVSVNVKSLVASFFGIDEAKLEQEKQTMLQDLRNLQRS